MNKLGSKVNQHGLQVAVFVLFFILFNWPLLSIVTGKGPWLVFLYLFITWGALVLILFLFCFGLNPVAREDGQTHDNDKSGGMES